MNILFFLCAEGSSTDIQSNLLSIFNVLEEVSAKSFPVVLSKATLCFLAEKGENSADTYPAVIKISQQGEEDVLLNFELDFKGKPRVRTSVELVGFAVKKSGRLEFSLEVSGEKLAMWPLNVMHVEAIS